MTSCDLLLHPSACLYGFACMPPEVLFFMVQLHTPWHGSLVKLSKEYFVKEKYIGLFTALKKLELKFRSLWG